MELIEIMEDQSDIIQINQDDTLTPEGWEKKELNALLEQGRRITYGIVQPGEYQNEGVFMIRSQDYTKGWCDLQYIMRVHPKIDAPYERSRVFSGDILITVVGANVGRVAIVPHSLHGANISRSVARLSINQNIYSSCFCFYCLQRSQRELVESNQVGGAQPVINLKALGRFKIAIPNTLKEQTAIATALSDADALINSLEKLIAKKRLIKQGTMQALLTGKKRLPGYSGKWEEKQLQDIAEIDNDNLSSYTSPHYSFIYISIEDVEVGRLKSYSDQVYLTAPSRARRVLKKYDLLFSTVRPNLKSHLLMDLERNDVVCSTGFSVLRCRPAICYPKFIFQHLFGNVIERQLEKLLSGSNYPAINSKDVKSLTIPFPMYEEQVAIADVLCSLDEEIIKLEQKLKKIRKVKQGMMEVLLTGKVRMI